MGVLNPRRPPVQTMKNATSKVSLSLLSAFFPVLFLFTGCGGSSTGKVSQPANSTVTQVTVTCTPASVATGETAKCSAAVAGTGGYSSAVMWSASGGSVDATGMFTAPTAPGSATVTAVSTQDATKSGKAAVAVQAGSSSVTGVAVTCTPTTIAPAATAQCSATVAGTGTFANTVTWTASGGSISAAGLFTAPAAAGGITVTATSTQDTTKAGTASLTVQAVTAGTSTIPPSQHVVIVLEENQSFDLVVGRTDRWPHLNNLISTGALATNFYANGHFSIPNYFMLTSGVILSVNDNTVKTFNADNIARRLLGANKSFKIYAQSLPQAGYVGPDVGLYAKRHNPFAYYTDFTTNATIAAAHIVPFTQFAADVANNALPEFSFVVPDLVDDGHDSNPPVADDWMQANVVAPLQGAQAFQPGGDGLLIVDFDESVDTDVAHGGGHVPAVFWGPNVLPGFKQTSTTVYQQQSLLRTMMEALGLPNPMGAAATAPEMGEFFKQ